MGAIGILLMIVGFIGVRATDKRTFGFEELSKKTLRFGLVFFVGMALTIASLFLLAWRHLP